MPIIDQYFAKLIELGGSDLHLSQKQPPKVRVHGSIKPIAPARDTARALPPLSTRITAHIHASGMPNRRAAPAT